MRDLIKNILLEKITNSEIDEARISKYTENDILDTACKYDTMRDFMKNHKNIYQAAWRKDLLLKIKNVCNYRTLGNLFERMIYMYIWEENIKAVYFGLTCDEDRRYEEHAGDVGIMKNVEVAPNCDFGSTSAVRKFIQENGLFDRYVAITDGYIPARVAAAAEMCLIDHYRNDPEWKDNIIVVNRSKGGELGGRCSVNFQNLFKHSELILKELIQTPEELLLKHPRIHKYWSKDPSRKKMMNKRLGTRFFIDAPYSIEEILNIVSEYNNREEFSQKDRRAFLSAKRQKMLDILFPENETYKNLKTGESYDNLIDVSKKMNVNLEDLFNTVKRGQEKKYNINLTSDLEPQENLLESLIKKILKEETEEIDQKVMNFLLRRYKVNEVNIGDNIRFKETYFKLGDDYYLGISSFDNKKRQIKMIIDMLINNNVIEPIDNFSNENDPYRQKIIRTIKKFLSQVM